MPINSPDASARVYDAAQYLVSFPWPFPGQDGQVGRALFDKLTAAVLDEPQQVEATARALCAAGERLAGLPGRPQLIDRLVDLLPAEMYTRREDVVIFLDALFALCDAVILLGGADAAAATEVPPLTQWIRRQRAAYNLGLMANLDRLEQLDALGMAWQLKDQRWEQGLAAAREYHADGPPPDDPVS